jgi:hypothetical protein
LCFVRDVQQIDTTPTADLRERTTPSPGERGRRPDHPHGAPHGELDRTAPH